MLIAGRKQSLFQRQQQDASQTGHGLWRIALEDCWLGNHVLAKPPTWQKNPQPRSLRDGGETPQGWQEAGCIRLEQRTALFKKHLSEKTTQNEQQEQRWKERLAADRSSPA